MEGGNFIQPFVSTDDGIVPVGTLVLECTVGG